MNGYTNNLKSHHTLIKMQWISEDPLNPIEEE